MGPEAPFPKALSPPTAAFWPRLSTVPGHCSGSGTGAIYSANTLSILSCTFYGNSATNASNGYGGAVLFYASGKTLTLTGNVFHGNTAYHNPALYHISGTVVASYNVVDVDFGTANTQAGWAAGTGDTTLTDLSIASDPFDAATFVPVSGLQSVLPSSAPADFPATDFYGTTRTFPGAPGAVATAPSP